MYIPVNQILVMKDIRGIAGSAISQSYDAYGDLPLVLPIALALSIAPCPQQGHEDPNILMVLINVDMHPNHMRLLQQVLDTLQVHIPKSLGARLHQFHLQRLSSTIVMNCAEASQGPNLCP